MIQTLLIFLALIVAPGMAGWQSDGGKGLWFLLGWYLSVSGLTYFLYVYDKRRARSGACRVPEPTLHMCELAGGWPGALLALQRRRHKKSRLGFQLVFWFIVGTHQFVAVDYLFGGRFMQAAVQAIGDWEVRARHERDDRDPDSRGSRRQNHFTVREGDLLTFGQPRPALLA